MPKRGQAPKARGFRPSTQEVLGAIESLYADELRPCGRTLRRRVGEVEAAKRHSSGEAVDVDVAALRRRCDESPQIRVVQESGGDWCALLQGVEERFVDVHSSEDTFGEEEWRQAEAHFREHQEALPGSRYACARALAAQELPFLAQLSLGRICHFVQLAISQKKLLGHQQGALVPYELSRAMVKEQHALQQRPCESAEPCENALASLPAARATLAELLRSGPLPLSNLKRLFRSHARLELSETALGFPKLCDLLQSEHFGDVCEVRLAAHGHVVHPRQQTLALAECLEGGAAPGCFVSQTTATLGDCGETQGSSSAGKAERAESEQTESKGSQRRGPAFSLDSLDFGCLDNEDEDGDRLAALPRSTLPATTPARTPAGARFVPPTPSPWSPIPTPVPKTQPVPPTPAPFGDGSSW